jgi:hypothetical protein
LEGQRKPYCAFVEIRHTGLNKHSGTRSSNRCPFFSAENEQTDANDLDFVRPERSYGYIVISTDMAVKQANEAGHALGREVDELVIHV